MYRNTSCRLQAHRGVSTEYPENTMLAFRKAVEQGYDVIEFDPKMTRDGVCVIMHDRTLNRTCRFAGCEPKAEMPVSGTDFRDLAEADAGVWKAKEFAGEPVPSLSQALDYMKAACIEAKIDNVVQTFSDEEKKKVFDIIEKHGMKGNVGMTGSDIAFLELYAGRFPGAPIHYDGEINEQSLCRLKNISSGRKTYVWMRFDNQLTSWNKTPPINEASAERIKRDFLLGVWILSDDSEMQRVVRFFPDIVETTGGIKPGN